MQHVQLQRMENSIVGDQSLKGVGNNQHISSPAHIPHSGTNVTDVSVGGYHTCALLENGSVMCWGRNDFGQRGLGYTQSATDPFTERAVIDFGNDRTALQVSAGTHHSCAILEDWEIVCWGNNTYGQLGNTPSEDSCDRFWLRWSCKTMVMLCRFWLRWSCKT